MEPHLPRFRYLLQDLSELPDTVLRGRALREAVLLAFKHAADGSVWEVGRWLEVLVAVATQDGLSALEALWRYVLTVAPTPPPPSVRAYLTERLPPEMERFVMGYGEQLMVEARQRGLEQGLERGREEGLEQGREQGVRQGEARVLSMLLERRFGPLPVDVARRIDAAAAAELERWVARVLDADSVDGVFGDPEAG